MLSLSSLIGLFGETTGSPGRKSLSSDNGRACGQVLQGTLHCGHKVRLIRPSGTSASFYIVGLYWNRDTFSHPMLMVNMMKDASEYAFCIVLEGIDHYSAQGSLRKVYTHHHPDQRFEDLSSKVVHSLHFHCFVVDEHTDFELPLAKPTNKGKGSSSSAARIYSTV